MGKRGPRPKFRGKVWGCVSLEMQTAVEQLADRKNSNVSAEVRAALARHLREAGIKFQDDDQPNLLSA